jgi:hypothetical protein
MAYLVLSYDRPPAGKDSAYNDKVRTWITVSMSMKGAVSLTAYRNVWPMTPTNLVWIEFDTVEAAEAAARHPDIKATFEEMRALGATTLSMILLEKSPYTPEPIQS